MKFRLQLFPRAAWLGLVLTTALRPLFSAELPAENVVALPPLMVEEKGAALTWRYLATPEIELLSVCEEDTMKAFAERYHRLDELLVEIVPRRFWTRRNSPETHVIFNEEVGRARSQEVISEMLQGLDRKATPGSPAAPKSRSAAILTGSARIRFLPNMRLSDSDIIAVFAILQDTTAAASHYTFAAERVNSLLQERTPRLPEWFVAGTVGFFSRTRSGLDDIEVDSALWTSAEDTEALKADSNAPRTLLPLEELLTRRPPDPGAAFTESDKIWNAEAALFVRWAITTNKGAHREDLWKFIDRLEKEPLTEALFREHFGVGYSDARDRLSDYLPVALQERLTLPAPKSVPLPRLKARLATDSEIARIRGGWERLEIAYVRKQFPDLVDKYVEQAKRTLYRSYSRNDRDPRLLAEIGLIEIEGGDLAAGRGFLENAVQSGVPRASPYYQLALLRLNSFLPEGGAQTRLTPVQTANVLEPLIAGRRFEPPLIDSYVLMDDVWKRSDTPPKPEELAFFNDGARLFAHSSALIVRAMALNLARGQFATALELADAGVRAARDPSVRERLRGLRETVAATKK